MEAAALTDAELRSLRQREITTEEARRQLALLRRKPRYMRLVRPCIVGDGIRRLDPAELSPLHARHEEAARGGRFVKFVPASGAATRMFRELLRFQSGPDRRLSWTEVCARAGEGDEAAAVLRTFIGDLPHFPFYDELARTLGPADPMALAHAGDFHPILDALLGGDAMDCDALPKGLLRFHRYPEGSRTAFEEHLVEAAHYVRDERNVCRLHFTVSPEHRAGFDRLLAESGPDYARRFGVRYEVAYSVQKPSTDTLAIDAEGRPVRDPAGGLLFRPGGHGALIENLDDLMADLVFVKNIDNVQPDSRKETTYRYKRALSGLLISLQQRAHEYLDQLRRVDPPVDRIDDAWEFVREHLGVRLDGTSGPNGPQSRRAFAIDRLNRPIRVCGVVPNTGEPGGGPFWTEGRDGRVELQIVEKAQVDPGNAMQQEILGSSTHFNPVDLVCAVRDALGQPFDLHAFVDPEAAIVTRKSIAGRDILALERPGLWNGGMAGWNTVFVETPLETFSPVKSVLDLLRDEHRG